jgi:predicted transcriptional regulator
MSLQVLNKELERLILQIAREERRQPEAIVDEALQLYLERRSASDTQPDERLRVKMDGSEEGADDAPPMTFLLSVAGIGRSGQSNVATDAEEILAAEIDPKRGWSLRRDNDEGAAR